MSYNYSCVALNIYKLVLFWWWAVTVEIYNGLRGSREMSQVMLLSGGAGNMRNSQLL